MSPRRSSHPKKLLLVASTAVFALSLLLAGVIAFAAGVSGETAPPPASADAPEGGDEGQEEAGPVAGPAAEEEGEAGDYSYASAPLPQFEALKSVSAELDLIARARSVGGRLVVPGADGDKTLTVDPSLQGRVTAMLKGFAAPYGAVVAMDPATGRVLALVEHSQASPGLRGLALKAVFPAASVFKVVTGAALLSEGIGPDETVCIHGGKRRLNEKLLADDPRRDRACLTLTEAMGHSANVVFAKLANRKLDAAKLTAWAERFGFNSTIPFAEPLDVSVARIPSEPFGLANTAAGFGETFLSPVHGALLAATVANRGVMMSPLLLDGDKPRPRRVLEPAVAAALAEMMENTVTSGTARRAFRERGRPALGDIRAAGKTGSLADKKPFRDYSWFVGFAPVEAPRIAVAAVVVNGSKWRVRAPFLARETMRLALEPDSAAAPLPRHSAKGSRRSR